MDKNGLFCRSADKVSCSNSAFVQRLPMGFWQGKWPLFWTYFLWIHKVLSPLQLCRINFTQNTPPTLCSGPIFRVGRAANFLKNLPRVQHFLLASFFVSSPKVNQESRCPRFPVILAIKLHDIIPYIFLFGLGFPFIEFHLDWNC